MKKFTNELKTGLVIFMALLAGLFLWAKTSNFNAEEAYRLKTYFRRANGIKENAVVALAGIEVGRVESVKFLYTPGTKIELVLLLDRKAKVRADSIAYIDTTGFVGDAYIGITPGDSEAFLKDGDTIISEDPVEMRELMRRADEIAENLDAILTDVKTVVSDNKGNLDNIVVNLEQASANFNALSEDIKKHPWKLLFKDKEKKKRK